MSKYMSDVLRVNWLTGLYGKEEFMEFEELLKMSPAQLKIEEQQLEKLKQTVKIATEAIEYRVSLQES